MLSQVCLLDMEPDDMVRGLTECGHSFHKECVDFWLQGFKEDSLRSRREESLGLGRTARCSFGFLPCRDSGEAPQLLKERRGRVTLLDRNRRKKAWRG